MRTLRSDSESNIIVIQREFVWRMKSDETGFLSHSSGTPMSLYQSLVIESLRSPDSLRSLNDKLCFAVMSWAERLDVESLVAFAVAIKVAAQVCLKVCSTSCRSSIIVAFHSRDPRKGLSQFFLILFGGFQSEPLLCSVGQIERASSICHYAHSSDESRLLRQAVVPARWSDQSVEVS